jgi:thimet oligopeptidase
MKEEGSAQFGMEDLLYYIKRAEELKVDLDIGEIKQYFPVSLVISGMLKMFQDLFGKKMLAINNYSISPYIFWKVRIWIYFALMCSFFFCSIAI